MTEIPHQKDICRIMSLATEKRDKAIIALISTSGMQPRFIRNLTYNQLLNACNHFFKDDEPKTIENLLYKNPIKENLIACFDIGAAASPRVTCCTPEALQLLFQYIYSNIRYSNMENIEDKVFLNNRGNPLTKNYVSDVLSKLSDEILEYGNYEAPKITATSLRERFSHICKTYLEGQRKNQVIELMRGSRSSNNKEFYEEVINDKQILVNDYESIVDCLSLSQRGNCPKNTTSTSYTVRNF